MSLLLAYHDLKRCCVVSDDRSVIFSENGEVIAMPDRVPKFVCVAGLIFACLGTSDVCTKLNDSTRRMLADHPELTVTHLRDILPPGLSSTFAKRRQDPNRPLGFDNLEAAVLGYDAQAKRMRSFVFVATDGFQPVETTANPANRIFALGHYNATDTALLERLTAKMQVADSKGLPWIAAQLRAALAELHERYPVAVGEPSFYAALDSRGPVELPGDFPPARELELAAAAHHTTTNKETAFAGTNRFFVGSILTPAAGQPDTIGNNDGGSGAQYGMTMQLNFASIASASFFGSGVNPTNPTNCINLNGFSEIKVNPGGTGGSFINAAQPAGVRRKIQSWKVAIDYEVVQNNTNGAGTQGVHLTWIDATGAIHVITDIAEGAGPQARRIDRSSDLSPNTFAVGSVTAGMSVNTLGSSSGSIDVKIFGVWLEVTE